MLKPKRILVPTDFSEHSDTALAKALEAAEESGGEITMLHVIHQDFQTCVVDYCFTADEIDRIKSGMVDAANESLQKELARFSQPITTKVSTAVRQGVPYEEILKFQEEKSADLIVIGSHGRSGIAAYIMGSVASRVAAGAKCPVLVVK
jgi:universal stress protein A